MQIQVNFLNTHDFISIDIEFSAGISIYSYVFMSVKYQSKQSNIIRKTNKYSNAKYSLHMYHCITRVNQILLYFSSYWKVAHINELSFVRRL